MAMWNITAELTTFPADARTEFTASFGAQFTDHDEGVTAFAGAIDSAWVPIFRYALVGVVGEAAIVSFEPTELV